jgi:hypothetical protein
MILKKQKNEARKKAEGGRGEEGATIFPAPKGKSKDSIQMTTRLAILGAKEIS